PVLAYAGSRHDSRWLWAAAVSGDGLIVDAGPDLASRIAPVLRWRHETALIGPICTIGGHGGRATALLRSTPGSGRVLLALAPDPGAPALLDMGAVAAVVPSGTPLRQDAEKAVIAETPIWIDGQALLRWQAPATVQATRHAHPLAGATQSSQARIGIERLTPNVDGGAWPVKRISHEALDVEADIFTDGHLHLAADLCWRAVDEVHWQRVAMSPQGNDRWHARCRPQRLGRHEYCIQAWVDTWTGMCADWQARHEAGQDLTLSLHEGEQWLSHILKGLGRGAADKGRRAAARQALSTLRLILRHPGPEADIEPLLDEGLAAILRDPGEQPFCTLSAPFPLQVDRALAGFGQWYTLFPRSQSSDANRHGTFDDVIERLPDIRRMGFDVLYLTPIHPVGLQNRKGRNNTLIAQEGDVGSPYAIGADEGGHTAIHPQLGSLEDFQRLVNQARDCDLEVALDFAIQCSPDHPWLRDHPDWFSWRPDGSLRHAENPPKKYEDIVNVVFYDDAPAHARKDALWETLRDVVMFWVDQGVRLFRVDNPHTKPLPFWQWLIADVQARAPDVVFLSEAFTRPAMMYRLAKLGFTQSYTYFTWRNDPRELGRYLQALSSPPLVDFFRPNFFVNTPDINPFYLQRHGRPGFLARAALAATGAGLWGIYSGFELCESAPLPGREEYMDSEKYELRPRQWLAPGHIRDEIAQLNAIRSANPALHGVRGFQSLAATPDSVLAYLRTSADRGNIVLVLVNLDPQRTVDARVSLGTSLPIDNLLAGTIERWDDGWMQVRLTPEAPYRLWRLPAAPVVAPSSSEPESTHA
ncbi:MAG TPA: maltotransferase domain-containing protein, partial [Castellaniella sp.]|nr:maltotransferase domain-containing protein [Castellaniella sp.]